MPNIALLLLGNPELHVRNRRIDIGVKRLAALAYLALNGKTRRRMLAELLWPDSDNPLNNLAVARNDLSRILGPDGLEVDAQSIGLGSAVQVDVHRWRTATQRRDPVAWGLYRGAFLEELRLNDWANGLGDGFETWLLETRETLALEQREFAYHLGLEALRESDFERALGFLKVAHGLANGLVHNPNEEPREDATRWYILTLGAIGQHDAAVTAFAHLRQRLLEELEVEPNLQTRQALELARTNPEACRAQIVQALNTQRANKPRREPQREQPPLVGRETQLRELEAQLENAPTGFTLFVRGESGVGKTRLLQTLQERIGGQHQIFKLEFVAGQAPLSPLERAVRQLVTAQAAQAERLPTLWKIALGRFVPNLLPDLLPNEAPPSEPELERIAAFSAIRALLEPLGPTWLHLEDLQWADRQSLELVQYLRSNPPETGLLQTLTWRDTETRNTPDNEHLNTAIQSWTRSPHASLHLRGLEEAAIQELAEWFERPEIDPHELRQRTNGNPLYVTEWLRTQNAQPKLEQPGIEQAGIKPTKLEQPGINQTESTPNKLEPTKTDPTTPEQTHLEPTQPAPNPTSQPLHNLIRTRIEDLGPDTRQTLEALAIIGANSTLGLLQRTSGRSLEQTSTDLETASQAQLTRHDTNGIRFNHDLTLEVIQNDLGPARLSLLHLRAARATHATPLTSAQHYWQARDALSDDDTSKAYDTYIEAGAQLGLRGEISEAMTWYERALEHARDPNERVRVMTNQARTLERFAHYDEASALLERIEPLLEMVEPVTAATALNVRSYLILNRYGDVVEGFNYANKALKAIEDISSVSAQLERGRSKHSLGWCAWRNRNFREAEKQFQSAIILYESMGNQADLASSMVGLGISRIFAQKDGVQDVLEQAIVLAKKSNNQNAYAFGLNYLGDYYRRVGNFEKAIASFNSAIESRNGLGEDFLVGSWLNNLGLVFFDLNEFKKARENYFRALKMRDVKDNVHYLRVVILGNLAEVNLRLREFDEARVFLQEAISLADETEIPTLCSDFYWWLGDVEVFENNLTAAKAAYGKSLKIAQGCAYNERVQTAVLRLARLSNDFDITQYSANLSDTPDSRAVMNFLRGDFDGALAEITGQNDSFEFIRLKLDIARITGNTQLEKEALDMLPL